MPPDAVGRADALRAEVGERLEKLVAGLDDGADPGKVYVGWFAACEVAECPTKFRARGIDGWAFEGWSPPTAAAALGRSALARYLDQHATASGDPPALLQPLDAVKAWMREARETPTSSVAEWVTHLSQPLSRDRAGLAAAAALATRWIAGFVRVVGWPLPDRLALVVDDPGSPSARRPTPPWRPRLTTARKVPITVASRPDAVIGAVAPSGQFDLVFHRPTSGDDRSLGERAAYEAAAASLAIGIVPHRVLLTTGDTGEQLLFVVDDELLDRGARLAEAVVRERLRASEPLAPGTAEHDDATPSNACRFCPTLEACSAGTAWLTRPARWHNGLPVLTGP